MSVDLVAMLPRKRQKIHHMPDYEAFSKGNIIRCKLFNFMSYSLTEFHCDPNMNLIIGPNGSGKSTFVCAVCIGLGGKLAFLGKETMTVNQFIKEGETEAFIELELKASDENVAIGKNSTVIRRELSKNSPSTWIVDGESHSERSTKSILDEYNIQLDNLCQFLPQDRVSKFADLKPEDLLREIERSYENGDLLAQHDQIIKFYQEVQNRTKDLDEKKQHLELLKEKSRELQSKAAKHKEYINLQSEIKRTKMVKPFFKLESLMDEKRMAKYKIKEREKEINEFNKHFRQFYQELKNVSAEADTNEKGIHLLKKQISEIKQKKRNIEEKVAQLEASISEKLKKVEEHQDRRVNIEEKLRSANHSYKSLQITRDEIQIVSEAEFKELHENQTKHTDLQRELVIKRAEVTDEINRQRRQIQKHEAEIASFQRQLASTDRLDQLDNRRHNDLIRALKYLRGNDSSLNYFEPPLLTLSVQKNVSFAFDQIIPTHIKNSFVVTNTDNFRKLTDVLFDQAKIRVSVRSLTSTTRFEPKVPKDVLQKFGFDGYLIDFVTGPKEVIQMLCENTYLHEIPVSINGLEPNVVEKFQDWNKRNQNVIVKFISGNNIFTSNRSRYGKKQVILSGDIVQRRPNLFGGGIPEERKEMIHREINKLKTQIQKANRSVEESQATEVKLNTEYSQSKDSTDETRRAFLEERNKRNKREKYDLKINDVNDKIKHLEKELRTLDMLSSDNSRKNKIIDQISLLEDEKVCLATKYVSNTNKQMLCEMQLSELTIKTEQQQIKSNRLKNVDKYLKKKNEEFTEQVSKLKLIERRANEAYVTYKQDYTSQLNQYTSEEKQIMKEYITTLKNKFTNNEENEEENATKMEMAVENEITKMKSKLSLLGTSGNSEVIELLETNKNKILELEDKIPELENVRASTWRQLQSIKELWKPQLDRIVKIVDTDFGDNMRIVASGGSVSLDESNPDFSKWKLIIKVSFRDAEELTQFNGAQHSGGEKSTTTAVFLNSLQGLTNTPFRIVDEINQGMDSKNERNAHKLIVQKATDSSVKASQYFLITPKLLTDLYYSQQMSIHCIFAGKWTPMFHDSAEFLEVGVFKNYIST